VRSIELVTCGKQLHTSESNSHAPVAIAKARGELNYCGKLCFVSAPSSEISHEDNRGAFAVVVHDSGMQGHTDTYAQQGVSKQA
jgi:hypothetical protein